MPKLPARLTKEESRRNEATVVLRQTLQTCGETEEKHAAGNCKLSARRSSVRILNIRQICGLKRFMRVFDGISNRIYGTKLSRPSGHVSHGWDSRYAQDDQSRVILVSREL